MMRFTAMSGAAALALVLTPLVPPRADGAEGAPAPAAGFQCKVIATGLEDPYEIVTASDSALWLTEKTGRRVLRMDPATGQTRTALDLSKVASHSGQDGVLGLALRERSGKVAAVFVSYTYPTSSGLALRIVRYSTAADGVSLTAPRTVIEGLPAGVDHQGGRLRLGADGLLYYTIGDQGANQFASACVENKAQRLPTSAEVAARNWVAYQGKTLRMTVDGAIPADNPVLAGVRSHVFTYGHRNPQGLDVGRGGVLVGSEQGPKTDDEVNLLVSGGNYGWPFVSGYRDDKSYTYGNWSKAVPTPCKDLSYDSITIPPGVPQQQESDWRGRMVLPLTTVGSAVNNGFNFTDPACAPHYNMCHPTFAPSSLSVYTGTAIRGWQDSLLVTTLKTGEVYRIDPSGTLLEKLWRAPNRYRDTAVSRDGRTIYVVTDRYGTVRTGGVTTSTLQDRGAVIAYTRVGP